MCTVKRASLLAVTMAEAELDAVRTEFDLFSEAPLQRMVKHYRYDEVYSFNNVKSDATITFQVRGTPNQWVDLDDTYMMVKYKMVTHDGNDIANVADTCVRTIEEPNIFHNLWHKVEMSIDNTQVKSVVMPYPMRPYIENMLTTPESGLHEKYETEGYWKEKAGAGFDLPVEDTVAHIAANTPWRSIVQNRHKGSSQHVLYGKLAVDLWRQGRNIPPTHDITLVLTKNRPNFYLRSSQAAGQEHKLELVEVKLIVKRVQLYDDAQVDIDQAIAEAGVIKYPVKRVDVKSYSLARGTQVFQENNIISGQIPSRVIVGMVDNDAFAGTFAKSPFNFKHYSVEEMYLHHDGDTFPSNRYTSSFGNRDALVPWLNLKRLVSPGAPFFHHTIAYDDYCNGGYTLWVFDMTQDNKCGVSGDYNNIKKSGDVRLYVKFGEQNGLPNPVNIVVYAEYENQIEIGRNRDLMQDY